MLLINSVWKGYSLRAMQVVVAEGPGLILLTNSPGWDFMSEIGLPCAGSNEASRQNNKIYAWCYCFYQTFYFFRSYSLQLTHWLMTHDSLTHLTHKTSVLNNNIPSSDLLTSANAFNSEIGYGGGLPKWGYAVVLSVTSDYLSPVGKEKCCCAVTHYWLGQK